MFPAQSQFRSRNRSRLRLLRAPVFLVLGLLVGCGTIQSMMPEHKKAEAHAAQMQELQLKVMRYADEYVGRIIGPLNDFQSQPTTTADERLAAQNWKVQQSTSAYTIASGPNPLTNALDMVVLATLSRMVMEDSWVKERLGGRAEQLADAHRRAETPAWALVSFLTPEQLTKLHEVIDTWRERNPTVRSVAYIHFSDFAKAIGRPAAGEEEASGNLFAMLGLDPLSNLDPAVREITQTRQLAERTIYYVQRMPNLLDMQVQRLTYQFSAMEETRQVLHDVNRVTNTAEAVGKVVNSLPDVIAREREAAISQFMNEINAQQGQLRGLVVELRDAMRAGTATSDSLNATIRSFDTLMARFQKPKDPNAPPGKPFDIEQYSQAARDFAATAQQLESLVRSLDVNSAGVQRVAQGAAQDLRSVVDHAFWRGVELVLIAIAAIFLAFFGYRQLTRLVERRGS